MVGAVDGKRGQVVHAASEESIVEREEVVVRDGRREGECGRGPLEEEDGRRRQRGEGQGEHGQGRKRRGWKERESGR